MEFQVMFTILFVAAGILLLEIAVKRETFDFWLGIAAAGDCGYDDLCPGVLAAAPGGGYRLESDRGIEVGEKRWETTVGIIGLNTAQA